MRARNATNETEAGVLRGSVHRPATGARVTERPTWTRLAVRRGLCRNSLAGSSCEPAPRSNSTVEIQK